MSSLYIHGFRLSKRNQLLLAGTRIEAPDLILTLLSVPSASTVLLISTKKHEQKQRV